jgi:hypothetical protein
LAIPTSTVNQEQVYIINQIDPSVSGATISGSGTSGTSYGIAGSSKVEILISVAGTTGAANGTIQFVWNTYEPTSGSIISTYNGSLLTGSLAVDHIGVYNSGTIIGVNGFLSWTATGVATATFAPVYARIFTYR